MAATPSWDIFEGNFVDSGPSHGAITGIDLVIATADSQRLTLADEFLEVIDEDIFCGQEATDTPHRTSCTPLDGVYTPSNDLRDLDLLFSDFHLPLQDPFNFESNLYTDDQFCGLLDPENTASPLQLEESAEFERHRYSQKRPRSSSDGSRQALSKNLRLTQSQTHPMEQWLSCNLFNPYPDKTTKLQLAESCGLSAPQVASWFARTRQRRITRAKQQDNRDIPTRDRTCAEISRPSGPRSASLEKLNSRWVGRDFESHDTSLRPFRHITKSRPISSEGLFRCENSPQQLLSFSIHHATMPGSKTSARRPRSCPPQPLGQRRWRIPHFRYGTDGSATNGRSSMQVAIASLPSSFEVASRSDNLSWRSDKHRDRHERPLWSLHEWTVDRWLHLLPADPTDFEATGTPDMSTEESPTLEDSFCDTGRSLPGEALSITSATPPESVRVVSSIEPISYNASDQFHELNAPEIQSSSCRASASQPRDAESTRQTQAERSLPAEEGSGRSRESAETIPQSTDPSRRSKIMVCQIPKRLLSILFFRPPACFRMVARVSDFIAGPKFQNLCRPYCHPRCATFHLALCLFFLSASYGQLH